MTFLWPCTEFVRDLSYITSEQSGTKVSSTYQTSFFKWLSSVSQFTTVLLLLLSYTYCCFQGYFSSELVNCMPLFLPWPHFIHHFTYVFVLFTIANVVMGWSKLTKIYSSLGYSLWLNQQGAMLWPATCSVSGARPHGYLLRSISQCSETQSITLGHTL